MVPEPTSLPVNPLGDEFLLNVEDVFLITGTVYSDPKSRHTTMSEDNIFQYYVGTTDYSASFVTLNGAYNDERIFPDETRHGVVIEFNKPVMVYQGQEIAIRGGGMTYGTFTVTGAPRNLK